MADTTEQTSLKGMIQNMVDSGVEVVQGTVTATSPLKIQIVNDDKLTISSAITYVPKHLTNYSITVDISGGSVSGSTNSTGTHTHSYSGDTDSGGDPEHTHSYSGTTESAGSHSHSLTSFSVYGATMTVYNALKVGDQVHLLSFNHGKQYYVLDRAD